MIESEGSASAGRIVDSVAGSLSRVLRTEWLRNLYFKVRAPVHPSAQVRRIPSLAEVDSIARSLRFPESDSPLVSVVIPVHGQLPFTVACLRSLAAHEGAPPFEVTVVDDASKDGTADALQGIPGLKLLRNAENLGFIGSCNAGARVARGAFLLFLNNDTEVMPGWMRELHRTLSGDPAIGLVGSKLTYPDGRLQEAGGLVFRDGSAANYGKFDDPRKPQYNYVREADYCSGASVMVPAALFREIGGFDTHFAPAYYEDTDLAFRIRKAGRKVVYHPFSEVVHFEGVTSGTDIRVGVKRHQAENAEKFKLRWEGTLSAQSAGGTPHELAKDRGTLRRILVIDSRWPTPDRDSGSVRMENLLRIWKDAGYAVTFIAIDYPARAPGYTDRLERNGVEAVPYPYFLSVRDHLRFYGPRYDAVQLVRGAVAKRCMRLVRRYAPRAKIIFDTVDLHFLRWSREAELTHDRKLAKRARAEKEIEIGLVRSADFTFVVSEAERGIIEKEAPDRKVLVVSNIHADRTDAVEPGGRDAMCFIGTYGHPPNLDAARFLLDEIMPLVRVELPAARLFLIGPDPPPELQARAKNGVEVTGHVADLTPLLASCRLSVAPLRFGAGVKGKLNTSMSFGVPVVATSLAAEGMHLVNGHDVLLGEDPRSLASAIVRLFRDDALWKELSTNGRKNVSRHFSFDLARSAIATLTNELPPRVGPAHGARIGTS